MRPHADLLRPIADDDDEVVAAFAAWLLDDPDAGPDDWHRFALGANWDFSADIMPWIVLQPDCDRATAALLFWKSQPDYYLDFADRSEIPPFNLEGYDLIQTIRERWTQGLYTRAELALDLGEDYAPIDTAALQRRAGPRFAELFPPDLHGPFPGRRLTLDDTIDGIPNRFWPAN